MELIKTSFSCLKSVLKNRELILKLAQNDFRTKYVTNYLGIVWAFIQPMVTIVIYVFVFQFGFKAAPVSSAPYVLWLVPGLVIWFFFSDAINSATNSLLEYSYLVKKVVFKVDILPMVKILSALFIHCIFIVITIFLYKIFGYETSLYAFQLPYYSFCTLCLAIGISYMTSSIVVFFRDLGQIVNIVLQFGMWLTPIMWDVSMLGTYQWIMKFNPMYYVVYGYREALIDHIWFWQRPKETLYFWGVTLICFLFGGTIFKKLEKHFSDSL